MERFRGVVARWVVSKVYATVLLARTVGTDNLLVSVIPGVWHFQVDA